MKVEYAELVWTDAGTPRSVDFDDIYHDANDPLGECRHVFLAANRIPARMAACDEVFVIAEAGFGSGLNFLLTVNEWLAAECPCRLHYLGFENRPLRPTDLRRSLARFPELAKPAAWLLEQYPPPAAGCHRLNLHEKLQLDLLLGDIVETMRAHGEGLRDKIHAWYLDGFSPGVNPGMWSRELFGFVADSSQPKATVSTYSAAGTVRHGLQYAGFAMKRIHGFGGKRHMLRGKLRKTAKAEPSHAAHWFDHQKTRLGMLLTTRTLRSGQGHVGFYSPAASMSPLRRGLLRAASRLTDSPPELERFRWNLPGWSNDGATRYGGQAREIPDWFRYSPRVSGGNTVAVIGAGVAGSATARQLARKNWRVTVFERAAGLEHGVNTLGQLALHCRTFGEANPLARFFLLGFVYSAREFGRLARARGFGWHPSGLAQLPKPRELGRKLDPAARAEQYPDEVLQWQSRQQLRDLTGLPIAGDGWHSSAAGWLDPLELCRCWLDHPCIELRTGVSVEAFEQIECRWNLRANGEVLNTRPFPAVVIACGADAADFDQLRELPLLRVPGEVVSIPENRASGAIRHIVHGGRAIFPAARGRHSISASYAKSEDGGGESIEECLALLEKMFEPKLEFAGEEFSRAKAPRCQSADFAPVVGAVPDLAECRKLYAPLARNARARIHHPPAHLPGLYVNLAHGSHGLCGAPLAAEYLTSIINGEVPPLDRGVAAALDPMRFLIRGLRRQQTGR